jgi:glycerol-3-phosphate dehydrogenase
VSENAPIGAPAADLLAGGLGRNLGGVFEAELDYFKANEWAQSSADVLWRRTKLGLHFTPAQTARLAAYITERMSQQ